MTASVCPRCQQSLVAARPDGDGWVRCGNCDQRLMAGDVGSATKRPAGGGLAGGPARGSAPQPVAKSDNDDLAFPDEHDPFFEDVDVPPPAATSSHAGEDWGSPPTASVDPLFSSPANAAARSSVPSGSAAGRSAADPSAADRSAADPPAISAVDDDDLFGMDGLPEFGDASPIGGFAGTTVKHGSGATAATNAGSSGTAGSAAATAAGDNEYRVKCTVCDSVLYARPSQTGMTMRCGDCHSDVVIPPPPKGHSATPPPRPASKLRRQPGGGDGLLGPAPAGPKPRDPTVRRASDILDQAERDHVESPADDYDTPDVVAWLKGVFGIFLDPTTLVWFAVLSVALSLVQWSTGFDFPILLIGTGLAGLVVFLAILCCGMTILESTAGGGRSMDMADLGSLDAWIGNGFYTAAATIVAAGPMFVLTHVVIGPGLLATGLTLVSVFALFPFVLLSMLDHDSVMMPFSPEVARSFNTCKESWGAMYLTSGLLLAAIYFLTIAVVSVQAGWTVLMFAAVGGVFAYFGMIGRLAYAIGQDVSAGEELRVRSSTDDGSA